MTKTYIYIIKTPTSFCLMQSKLGKNSTILQEFNDYDKAKSLLEFRTKLIKGKVKDLVIFDDKISYRSMC